MSPYRAPSVCAVPRCPDFAPAGKPRCEGHEAEYQRERNARRSHYRGAWRKTSERARQAQPWCSKCGATEDLTADHVAARSLDAGVDVLCRSCNTRKGG